MGFLYHEANQYYNANILYTRFYQESIFTLFPFISCKTNLNNGTGQP